MRSRSPPACPLHGDRAIRQACSSSPRYIDHDHVLCATGYELPGKLLDHRALLYLIRQKQGGKKKKAKKEKAPPKDTSKSKVTEPIKTFLTG
jgi:hypothetical protein